MLRVSDSITLDDREVHERFVRAFGPGASTFGKRRPPSNYALTSACPGSHPT
jgi:hypothetical protein